MTITWPTSDRTRRKEGHGRRASIKSTESNEAKEEGKERPENLMSILKGEKREAISQVNPPAK